MKPAIVAISMMMLIASCNNMQQKESSMEKGQIADTNLLPSWNKGTAKQSIVDFVTSSTKEGSSGFIPKADRIACFDNDGTLWSEQPLYFQLAFAIDRVKALASEHPEWKTTQPFKALLEGDIQTALAGGEHALVEIVMATHAGMTTDAFSAIVQAWINTSKHPQTGRLYKEMVYQPMLELLDYLRANGYKTFIVSGGGVDFMRPWVDEVYGIPADQVIGSSGKVKFKWLDGKPVLVKLPGINFIDDKEEKPVGIHQYIGKRPVFAAGNSDGDLAMLQYTASNELPSFKLYVHHTDSIREWAYDRDSHIGRFDKGLDEATQKGWTIINMKEDWRVIYPFELTNQ